MNSFIRLGSGLLKAIVYIYKNMINDIIKVTYIIITKYNKKQIVVEKLLSFFVSKG